MNIKRYWLEISVLLILVTVWLVDLSPDITWMSTDSDGAHYLLAAKYLTTAHHMSAPLYLLLGNLFLKIPLGTEAWRMGLMSVIGTMGTVVFIYLILRHLLTDNPKARWYALISVLVFGGSALIISQSTIIETYTLSMMCGVGGYYFALKKKWIWASVILGIGLAIHPFLSFIVWAVLFIAYKEMRNWKRYSITIAFFAFYLYIPIVAQVNPNANMWGNENPEGFIGGTLGMVVMLTGGLSMWDMPKRILDTLLILGVSFGLGIIPMIWYFIKTRSWRNSLLWLTLIPIIYFAINLAAPTYVYMIVSVAFGSIAVGLGIAKLGDKCGVPVMTVAILLLLFNSVYFDIGEQLDPEMSAMKFYNEELPKISDGEYFMGGGWTWSMVYLYNRQEGRDIIPISIDALPDKNYWSVLDEMGVNYDRNLLPFDTEIGYISKQGKLALSIAENNDGVWIAKETKPEVYQYEIVPAKGNEAYVGRWIGQEIEPSIRWKPSNPYLFISGQLEVSEWHHILWSSHNAFYVISFIVYGFGLSWLVVRFWKRKRKGNEDTT